ncbi:hypothetical protein J6590_012977 [Homalodisca vitripennis]|nr:hypothetical protein J6590_012977 [Homalodisca vitripennis]
MFLVTARGRKDTQDTSYHAVCKEGPVRRTVNECTCDVSVTARGRKDTQDTSYHAVCKEGPVRRTEGRIHRTLVIMRCVRKDQFGGPGRKDTQDTSYHAVCKEGLVRRTGLLTQYPRYGSITGLSSIMYIITSSSRLLLLPGLVVCLSRSPPST